MRFNSLIARLFGKGRSTQEVVWRAFPEDQRDFAVEFYASWPDGEYLVVELGDGFHDLTREGFYRSAIFCFGPRPVDMVDYVILGGDLEDEEGMVVLDKPTGKVFYAYEVYDNRAIELANDLRDFLANLQGAGWSGTGVSLQ